MMFRRENVSFQCHCEERSDVAIQKIRGYLLSLICLPLLFAACGSDSGNTAGVWTETESGQQVAGVVLNADGNPVANAELVLVSRDFVAARKLPYATAVSANDGSFKLEVKDTMSAMNGYSVFVTTADGLSAMQSIEYKADSVTLKVAESALLQVDPYVYNLKQNDTLCVLGTPYCVGMDSAKFANGELIEFKIPAIHVDTIVAIRNSVPQNVEVSLDLEPGDSVLVNIFTQAEESYKMQIPDSAVTGYTLPNFIVPVKNPPSGEGYCVGFDNGESSCTVTSEYAVMPYFTLESPSMQYGYSKRLNAEVDDRRMFNVAVHSNLDDPETVLWSKNAFNENHSKFVVMWLKMDGKAEETDGYIVLTIGTSTTASLMFRQCTDDKEVACVRINSGLEDASVDTTLYGAAKVFDNEWHSYAISIYEKHLTIVVDGKLLRDTDIKVASEFYDADFKLGSINTVGRSENLELESVIEGRFDETMLFDEPGTKWNLVSAWLRAEHYMFKDYYGF